MFNPVTNYRRIREFFRMERERSPQPFGDKALLCHGFFSSRRLLYPLNKFPRPLFLSDWEIEFNLGNINKSDHKIQLNDKSFFHLLLGRDNNPQFLGIIKSNKFISYSDNKSLDDAIKANGEVFIKPAHGRAGKGVIRTSQRPTIDLPGRYVVEAPVVPHASIRAIYPGSLNTIRVLILRDKTGPFIIGAVHRFGSEITGYIDNFSSGGLAANISLDSGVLSIARSNPGVYKDSYHIKHPDTGEYISGVKVPLWEEVRDFSLHLSGLFPELNYIGWDIAVTKDQPMVIEGNAGIANPNILQAHAPLLRNTRIIRYMAEHKVISPRRSAECLALIGDAA